MEVTKNIVETKINKEKLLETYSSIIQLYLLIRSFQPQQPHEEKYFLGFLDAKDTIYNLVCDAKEKIEELVITREDILEITTA
jgi:hypothetical protein